MNKTIKFLISTLCGALLFSSLAFMPVQASTVNNNININALSANYPSDCTLYYHFGRVDAYNMCVYMKIKYQYSGITESTFKGWIMNQEDVPANVANNIAPYLWELGPEYILEVTNNGQKGLDVVKAPAGNYRIYASDNLH